MRINIPLLCISMIFSFALGCGDAKENVSEEMIVGGSPVRKGLWDAVVGITHAKGGIFCTGTALNANLVVTAAHCLVGKKPSDVRVYVGSGSAYKDVVGTFNVERLAVNPLYKGRDNDIAYLVLRNPLSLKLSSTDYPKLLLNEKEKKELLAEGATTYLVGYGSVDADDGGGVLGDALSDLQDALDEWTATFGSRGGSTGTKNWAIGKVHKYLAGSSFNSKNEIILGGNGIDACQGDSGGPAFGRLKSGNYRVYGVTSRGVGCGNGGVSGLMFAHVCWLEKSSKMDLNLPYNYCN
ncbi:MAG: trypsin-like serine protease [Proteobacteria bacterium]|nr:MAG: trypsin-like serine protease [Pseudomonadota bacterium]